MDCVFRTCQKGYKDFEKTLELTGVLHWIGVKTQEEFKRDAEGVFEQFQMYCGAIQVLFCQSRKETV